MVTRRSPRATSWCMRICVDRQIIPNIWSRTKKTNSVGTSETFPERGRQTRTRRASTCPHRFANGSNARAFRCFCWFYSRWAFHLVSRNLSWRQYLAELPTSPELLWKGRKWRPGVSIPIYPSPPLLIEMVYTRSLHCIPDIMWFLSANLVLRQSPSHN